MSQEDTNWCPPETSALVGKYVFDNRCFAWCFKAVWTPVLPRQKGMEYKNNGGHGGTTLINCKIWIVATMSTGFNYSQYG